MLPFKDYLNDNEEEQSEEPSYSSDNPAYDTINAELNSELFTPIYNPQAGIQKIRKVLTKYGYDMPAVYGLEEEGDELTFELTRFEDDNHVCYLYLIYYLTDADYYDFYAQVGDEKTIDDLVSEEVDEE